MQKDMKEYLVQTNVEGTLKSVVELAQENGKRNASREVGSIDSPSPEAIETPLVVDVQVNTSDTNLKEKEGHLETST